MALSSTEIANMAIKHLGHAKPIQSLDTDKSAAGHACRTFYNMVVRLVLRDFKWPFAQKILTMQLTQDEPGEHWEYAYQYPVNCARFGKIQSDVRVDSRYTKIPYQIARGTSGKIILTEKEDAICEYTEFMTNPAYWDDDFAMALSWRLAFYIAPSITGGDPYKLQNEAMKMYQYELGVAKENALEEQMDDDEAVSEYELSRI